MLSSSERIEEGDRRSWPWRSPTMLAMGASMRGGGRTEAPGRLLRKPPIQSTSA